MQVQLGLLSAVKATPAVAHGIMERVKPRLDERHQGSKAGLWPLIFKGRAALCNHQCYAFVRLLALQFIRIRKTTL